MKSVVLATALALIASDVALAASQQNPRSQRAHLNANAMMGAPDSANVYLNGQLIGRDPDPSVRFRLRSDHYSGQGN